MANFNCLKLGDVVETQKGFAFKSAWYSLIGRPIIKVSDFTNDSVDITKLAFIPEEIAAKYLRYELFEDDVIIQTVGSWPSNPASVVGKCIRISKKASGALLNQNAVKLTPKTYLDKKFLFYLLREDTFKTYIIGTAQGAASQAAITLDSIRAFEFILPPLPIQHRIASILSAYDDLIENNTRRIAILEEMARRIYEEWFVHFRFLGHENFKMVNSELGKIPEGWKITTLGQAIINHDRKRKPLSQMQRSEFQGAYPYYGAAKILDHVKEYLFDGRYVLMAEDGSVITTDGFPVLQMANGRFWVNNHTHILEGTNQASTEFIYLRLSNLPISGYITGAAQPKITQENMNRIQIILPPDNKLMGEFTQLAKPFFDLINVLERKNKSLRTTRDFLLPKLISGEIDVSSLPEPQEEAAA